MIIQVVDANDETQNVVMQSIETPVDISGTLTTGASQVISDGPPAGFQRAGWFVQNKSVTGNVMTINELGGGADNSPTCVLLPPGATFPPPGYPVVQGAISLSGFAGDSFCAREWFTPVVAA